MLLLYKHIPIQRNSIVTAYILNHTGLVLLQCFFVNLCLPVFLVFLDQAKRYLQSDF